MWQETQCVKKQQVTVILCTDLRTYYVQYVQACTLTVYASWYQTLKQTAKYSLRTSKRCGFSATKYICVNDEAS